MTWFLPEDAPEDVAPPALQAVSGWVDRYTAAGKKAWIEADVWNRSQDIADSYEAELRDRLPGAGDWRKSSGRNRSNPAIRRARLLAVLAAQKVADPDNWSDVPTTEDEFQSRVMELRRAEYGDQLAVLDNAPGGGWTAELAGSLSAGLSDPLSIATLPLGGPEGRGVLGFLRMLGVEAALGAGTELAQDPARREVATDLGLPEPDTLGNMIEGAAGAAGFVGGIHALAGGVGLLRRGLRAGQERVTAYRAARGEATAAVRPEGVSPGSHEARIEAGGAALAGRAAPTASDAGVDWGSFDFSATGNASPQSNRVGYVYGRLIERGMPPHVAAGFVGNFMVEARPSIDPHAVGDGGKALGIAQWNDRGPALVEFARKRGKDWRDLDTQIDFVFHELDTSEAGAKAAIWATRTPEEAALAVSRAFERPGTPNNGARVAFARSVAEQAQGGAVPKYQGVALGDRSYDPYQPTSRGYTGAGQVSVGDRRIDVEYVVVDASKLQKATGRFQPRDRSRITSDVWIAETAARLDPAQLMPSPTAATGAPIVGPDMIIESGNGRFAAIQRAYALHPDRAAAYRQQIEAAGFAVPEGVKEPVLVARRKTPMNDDEREQFAIDAQDAGVARMTATEIAAATARQMTPERLALFQPGELMSSEANKPFMKAVLAALPRSERNAIFGEDGALNADGRRKVRDAFFSRAWNDDGPIGRMVLYQATEAEDKGELKTLLDALDEAAPAWATLKADIASGAVRPEFDITANVLDALNAIALARRDAGRLGASITEIIETLVSTEDMFDAINPLSLAMLRKFWHDGRPASAKSISGFLNRYAAEARTVGRIEDKLAADVGPAQVLRLIDKSAFGDLPDAIPPIARRISDEVANPVTAPDLPETAFANGADSPEAEAADAAAMDDLLADGPFGPRHFDIVNDPQAAIDRLMAEKAGEVPAAMNREDLGDIAFVYGTKAFGLRHIEAKHPEMLARLPELLQDGTLVGRAADRAYIQLPDAAPPSAVIRLDWDGAEKAWLVTAFDDAEGQVARQLQISNEPTASASSRIPDATGPAKDSVVAAENQDDLAAAIATARAEFDELGDFELPDGTRARDLLDEIDEDQTLLDVLDACLIGGSRT